MIDTLKSMIDTLKEGYSAVKAWVNYNSDMIFIGAFAATFALAGFVAGALIF